MAAKKDRDFGFGILNDIFSLNIIEIVLLDQESEKLCIELNTASTGQDKTHAKDDLLDAFRYAVVEIPWVMTKQTTKVVVKEFVTIRGRHESWEKQAGVDLLMDEFDEWSHDCEYLGY
jgi:hypothetical protein